MNAGVKEIHVSVIMPVYNSEKYLEKAIKSVLQQDFENYELILVNDGSSDHSGEICNRYMESNDKVRVIHKENGGICSARNAGLEAARGEYIGFCDNDDLYLPHLLRDNYKLAKRNNVDLMRYGKIKRLEKDDGSVWETRSQLKDMFIERKEFYKYYQNIRREDTVWTALYRREIIEQYHIRFDERFKYGSEDLNFNLHFLMCCARLGFNSKAYYSWTQRESHSTSRNFQRDYLKKNLINMDLEYEFYSKICQGKVNNIMKNVFLINSYVYPIIDYMAIRSGDMALQDKAEYLEEIRKHPLFDRELSKATRKSVRKRNFRVYLTMRLFYERRYKPLVIILDYGTSFLAVFRFKKRHSD